MKINKNIYLYTAILFTSSFIASCTKKEDISVEPKKPEKDILDFVINNANYPKVIHLYSDTVYNISGVFNRFDGEQLIIDAGTLIKLGKFDKNAPSGSTLGGIFIGPGGSIIANGSAQKPIIFTSNAPKGLQGTNWQGIYIKGKSFNNSGGTLGNATDFSCSLKYVRIEFSSLTLDGVGNQSVVENVQVSYTKPQSAFNILGGTFNARNLISYACGGPNDFYIGSGYTGKIQNILALRHPYIATLGNGNLQAIAGVYIENNSNKGALPNTFPVISNLTIIGPSIQNGINGNYARSAALIVANNAKYLIKNSLFLDYPVTTWVITDRESYNNLREKKAEVDYSIFYIKTLQSPFFLIPSGVAPFTSANFTGIVASYNNNKSTDVGAPAFYKTPFNYENIDLTVNSNSTILYKANFEGIYFSNSFFNKVNYIGAIGIDNWLQDWTNFIPLRTNYNQPQ